MAGLELTDKISKGINKRDTSLAIFMDLSKAFGTLDHQILLNKLNYYDTNDIVKVVFKLSHRETTI